MSDVSTTQLFRELLAKLDKMEKELTEVCISLSKIAGKKKNSDEHQDPAGNESDSDSGGG